MNKIITITLFLCVSFFANAQEVANISGFIKNKTNNEALPFVTIVLNDAENNNLVAGTISTENGMFQISGINPGDYLLNCSFIGFQSVSEEIHIGTLNSNYNLGTIFLNEKKQQIDEVTITAKRSVVSSALDKKSFAIADNVSQSGGSVLEAMKALPGVTLNQEGKIELRGSDKVSVLMDGKQSSLTGFGNQKGLDNIPAASIERIEIINNPSAKYDASGMAGIINIIYKKEKSTGFSGDAGLTMGVGELWSRRDNLPNIMDKYSFTPKYQPNIALNYRTEKINLFLQSDAIIRKKVNSNEFSERNYNNGNEITSQFLENRTQQQYTVKGGFDWYITAHNTLTAYALFDDEYHIDRGHVPYDDAISGERIRFWTWEEDERTYFMNYALNFTHEFTQPGHEFSLDFLYTKGNEDEVFPFTDQSEKRPEGSTDKTHLVAKEEVARFSADYVLPLKSGRLESGADIELRSIPITYEIFPGENSVLDYNLGQWSDYREDIYSAYLNYIFESRNWEIEAGTRLEQTYFEYKIDPENIYYPDNTKHDYLALFPNIRTTLKLDKRNKLSAFVNRRIDRPGEFEVRPFPKYDDPEILKTGNPFLKPQFTYTYELAYKRVYGTGTINASVFYRDIENIYARVYTSDNHSGYTVLNAIPENLGKGSNLGFEISWNEKVNEKLDINGSFNWYRNTIEAFEGTHHYPYPQDFLFEKQNTNTWNAKFNSTITVSKTAKVQCTAVYYAPDIIPQGKIDERFSFDVGYNKKFLKDKAELNIAATDLFNTFGIKKKIEGEDFSMNVSNYYETQVISVGLKYKF